MPLGESGIELSRYDHDSHIFDWRTFACGWGAAFINITVTYPIHKTIFRQMLHDISIAPAFQQIRSEGWFYLYRGILPPLAQKTISLSLMFGFYDATRRKLRNDFDVPPYAAKTIAGLTSGTVEAALLPFERVQTLLANATFHQQFKNTSQCIRYILTHYGIRELYRGIIPVLYRNGPSNACFFILKEETDEIIPLDVPASKPVQEFLAGAVIGASISTVFYPLNVIKVAMQTELCPPRDNFIECTRRLRQERRGIKGLYRGCLFNAYRSFLSWGIVNTCYEVLRNILW